MKTFLKSTEVALVNGGYVSTKTGEKPVTNKSFVKAQKHAEYIVTFASMAAEKDFVGKKADCLTDLVKDVKNALAAKATVYVEGPKKAKKKLTDELAAEAMAFMKFNETTSKTEKINAFLAQFDILNEFEKFGLFFKDGVVKLNKVYTMKEVIDAVTKTIDLLD